MKVALGCIVLYLMSWCLIAIRPDPPDTNTTDITGLEWLDAPEPDQPVYEEENEDIDEPELTWAEAHCAPKYYHPPEALVPDRWHPANILTGAKP